MKKVSLLIFFASLLFNAAPLFAQEVSTVLEKPGPTIRYDLYMGGFRVFKTALNIHDTPDTYTMEVTGQTVGIVNIFTSWEGLMKTKGKYTQTGEKMPQSHISVSVWPDNRQSKELYWDKQGHIESFHMIDEGEKTELADIAPDIYEGKIDIMTASLAIMQNTTRTGECGGAAEVFDGKRSFIIRGVHEGTEILASSRYNAYGGPAIKCSIRIIPLEGNWHEKLKGWMSIQEESRAAGTAPTLWLARPEGLDMAVPVKMQAKTSRGTFMMHIKEII